MDGSIGTYRMGQFLTSGNNQTMLLGSDLEETTDAETGWRAIINSSVRPEGKACLFKIPHHGSITGHSEDVWTHMVDGDAICLLTEHTRGKYSLPTDKDIERIKENTSKLFCTSLPRQKIVKRDSTVERTLRGMVKDRKSLGGDIGHVQVRITASGKARVGTQEPAIIL
jgi:beta-lactamase superfamily II metal-dependent hydrolase